MSGTVRVEPAATAVRAACDAWLGARRWPGDGARPVVAVHGLASNARLWDLVAERLAAGGHPVLAVDLRGHGTSADVPGGDGDPTRTAAADLAAVCEAENLVRPVVAGQSWGGNVALQLAVDHPGLVHGLVLVDGGWLHLGDRFADLDAAWAELAPPDFSGTTADALRARLARAHPDWSGPALDATLANLRVLPDGTVSPRLRRDRHRAIVGSLLAHRPRDLYPRVRCPVTLLAASEGHPLVAEALAAIPRATRQEFPGADHDLHAELPDAVAAAIGDLT